MAATVAATKSTTVVTDSQVLKVSSQPVYDPAEKHTLFSPVGYQGGLSRSTAGMPATAVRQLAQAMKPVSEPVRSGLTYGFTSFPPTKLNGRDLRQGEGVETEKGPTLEMELAVRYLLKDRTEEMGAVLQRHLEGMPTAICITSSPETSEDVTVPS